MAEAIRLVVVGACAGIPLAYALARFIESQLERVSAHDAATYGVVLAIVVVVGVAGSLAPALRAMQTELIETLKQT